MKTLEERFWAKVKVGAPDECWLWQASKTNKGYGQIARGRRGSGMDFAHRVAWSLRNGDPGGLCVCHRCDTPLCVNPAHLFLGTQADTQRDKAQKGRARNGGLCGEQHGCAKLTAVEVLEIRRRYATGLETQRALARCFNISRRNVGHIVRGKQWRHLR